MAELGQCGLDWRFTVMAAACVSLFVDLLFLVFHFIERASLAYLVHCIKPIRPDFPTELQAFSIQNEVGYIIFAVYLACNTSTLRSLLFARARNGLPGVPNITSYVAWQLSNEPTLVVLIQHRNETLMIWQLDSLWMHASMPLCALAGLRQCLESRPPARLWKVVKAVQKIRDKSFDMAQEVNTHGVATPVVLTAPATNTA